MKVFLRTHYCQVEEDVVEIVFQQIEHALIHVDYVEQLESYRCHVTLPVLILVVNTDLLLYEV